MKKSRYEYPVPEYQPDAVLNQAAPVQDTWYTILDTTRNVRIVYGRFMVATTNETLEVRITVDGQVLVSSALAATADTSYYLNHTVDFWNPNDTGFTLAATNNLLAFVLEGRSIKIDMRKTTAAGAGNLVARVRYAKW